jgi:GT2 family glycosyltransferase
MPTEFSIIIPNYNGRKLLESNLPSVEAAAARAPGGAEIIVVDDGSTDGSAHWLQKRESATFRPVILETNAGFVTAANAGAKAAKGKILYFLNSDIRVDKDFLVPLQAHFEKPDVFAVSSLAYDATGKRLLSARSALMWRLGQPDVDRTVSASEKGRLAGQTFFASGGHAAFRHSMFLELGGFDPLFKPFYFEDVDLGYRAWKRGWTALFEPASIVYHDHQSTIGKYARGGEIETVWRANRLAFTWKNLTDPALLAWHLALLPLQLAAAPIAGGPGAFRGFLRAFRALPAILAARRAAKSAPAKRSDGEILSLLRNPAREGKPLVCYFGAYLAGYPRSEVIRKGLERRGAGVVVCHAPQTSVFTRYLRLAASFALEARGCGVILVGEGRHLDVPLARLLGLLFGKKVILDAFISHYDTWVIDRAVFGPRSRQARALALADRWGARLASAVLLDTDAHIAFYSERYGIPKTKFARVLVGADDTIFRPASDPPEDGEFHVLYFGSYIALHGVETIIRAAKSLENRADIVFHLLGEGDTYVADKQLAEELGLKNLIWYPRATMEEIAERIAACHVCLGIFGTTGKAARVIPNKVYQGLAMKKAVVTADTPAARELLTDREHALLVPVADPGALAAAILELKNNPALRLHLAEAGFNLFDRSLRPEQIVAPILRLME